MMLHFHAGQRPFISRLFKTLLLTISLVVLQLLNVHAGLSQRLLDKRISLTLQNATIEKALEKIGKEANVKFVYANNLFTTASQTVSKSWQREKTGVVLNQLLSSMDISYNEMEGNFIVLKKAGKEKPGSNNDKLTPGVLADTSVTVRGRLLNNEGQPIIGASVTVAGSSKGTTSDVNGFYELKDISPAATLRFSYVGYTVQEVALDGRNTVNVSLQENAEGAKLNEVVVVGYATTTRRANTGSVSSITRKDIASQPVVDPIATIQGAVPGIFASASNGLTGSQFNVTIRGLNSLSAGSEPLYVIDGVPYFNESLNQFTSANGTQSPLATINPADIERIDILKDADATAIYGARGSNGVILISTRKGRTGKTKFDLNVFTGASKVVNQLNMLNTAQYRELRKEAFANDNIIPTVDNAPDLMLWDSTGAGTDWQDRMIGNTGKETQIQGSVSGGSEQTHFMISGTYRNATSVQANDRGFNRGSLLFNLDHTALNGKFNIATSVNYSITKDNSLASDLTSYYEFAPNYPSYDAAGKYYWFGNEQNPEAYFLRKSNVSTNNLIANGSLRYTVIPGLNAKVNLGFTKTNMEQVQTYPTLTFNPANATGSMTYFGFSNAQTYLVEPQLDYNKKISDGKLQLLLGATWQESRRQGSGVTASNFSSDALLENMRSAGKLESRPSSFNLYRYTSVFGRVNYNWFEKYIVNLTFRRDGSTRFGPDNRFGNFGAVGAAWIFTNEPFLAGNSILSFGKLRGSYGITGNDRIGDYRYLDAWGSTSYQYDGVAGLTPSRIPNSTFKWEESKKLEAAIELGFLNDRILLNTSVYRNISDNLLVEQTLSPQTGFDGFTNNLPATVLNSGVEIELNTINVKNKNFSWTSSFNYTFNHNELKAFPDFEASSYAETYEIGKSLTIVRGYQFTGVNPATGAAEFLDVDKDNSISDGDDYVILGKTMPDFYGGLRNTITYKALSFDFLFQFVKQEGASLNYGYLSSAFGTLNNNKDLSALDRWRKPGDVTNVPRATTTAANVNFDPYRRSSAMWGDASYIRLRNLSLRYNFANLAEKWNVPTVSVYILGQNLLTFTDYNGFDPETRGLSMPPVKTITAGLQITF
ncbi:MAG: SusC/RagA family TonB-linked outer membrane protein [Pedobacter sp.]|nr:MAG: SusC/RagA family TonB-linked outer membrane protein [Pedobacter sp.]